MSGLCYAASCELSIEKAFLWASRISVVPFSGAKAERMHLLSHLLYHCEFFRPDLHLDLDLDLDLDLTTTFIFPDLCCLFSSLSDFLSLFVA